MIDQMANLQLCALTLFALGPPVGIAGVLWFVSVVEARRMPVLPIVLAFLGAAATLIGYAMSVVVVARHWFN